MIRVPEAAKADVVAVCRRLYERGLVAGADGNVSIRLSRETLLATPTGMSKGQVTADDLVVCDLAGNQQQAKRRLTTEIKIHLAAYTVRDDVCAVVHAHPPHATAFAVAGITPSEAMMPEAYIAVGKVALAPYGTPSTDELAETLRPYLRDHDAVLLANHGAMTVGRDITAAHHRMEALEQLCRITYIARQLGGVRNLTREQMAQLDAIRGVYESGTANVPCCHCGYDPASPAARAAAEDAPAGPSPTSYQAPPVHWPGNPPVWERPRFEPSPVEPPVREPAERQL